MPAFLLALSLALFLGTSVIAQTRTISGTVREGRSGPPLPFANVRIDGSDLGTTTDRQGRYTLQVGTGALHLVASYIGYVSERRSVNAGSTTQTVDFSLSPTDVALPEFVVTPGDNPALAIIRKAIEQREKRRDLLESYSFSSHSKLVTVVAGDIVRDATKDSTVTGILESQTDAYWAKPNYYKEIVKARKQSSFIPSDANVMISAFFIADFSQDRLTINRKSITGPISLQGLKEYSYRLVGTTILDDQKIYMIDVVPWDEDDPLWKGRIYIADESYALMMVDLELNDSGLPPFFKKLTFTQHFRLFEKKFWMPVDVVVSGEVELTMIITVGLRIEGFSVLQNYRFNQPFGEDLFDNVTIKVLKEADTRDSTWWATNQAIPNTEDEIRAYLKADSVKMAIEETRNEVGLTNLFTGKSFGWGDTYLSLPGLLNLYHFNRVEGHALSFPLTLRLDRDPDHVLFLEGGYGFSRKAGTYESRLTLGLSRSLNARLTLGASDKLEWLDGGPQIFAELPATLSNLLAKYDHRDFYARRRLWTSLSFDPLPQIRMMVGVDRNDDESVTKNTDWSLLRRSMAFRDNPPINPGRVTSLRATFRYDGRDFIDNAGKLQRLGGTRSFDPVIGVGYHDADVEGKQYHWISGFTQVQGDFTLGTWGETRYRFQADWSDGALPTQYLYSLYGSPEYLVAPGRFQTLNLREFGGDRRIVGRIAHDFGDYLWRWLGIPLLKSSGFGLTLFVNGAWTDMRESTRALQTVAIQTARVPVYESGFTLRMFSFLDLSVAWRLNHFRDGRNVAFGISAALLGGGGGTVTIGL